MEKTIRMNDIIAFLERAIKEGLSIEEIRFLGNSFNKDWGYLFEVTSDKQKIRIYIVKDEYKIISIVNRIENGRYKCKWDLNEKEKLSFDKLYLDILEYRETKAINLFNNFFKKEDFKLTDINDLDNDDD